MRDLIRSACVWVLLHLGGAKTVIFTLPSPKSQNGRDWYSFGDVTNINQFIDAPTR